MKRCAGPGIVFGHSYYARYTELQPAVNMQQISGSASSVAEIIEATKPRIYVHDICVRCGDVVRKEQEYVTER